MEAIQAYLDTGGDLIVLTDPAQDGQDLTNLEALMGEYGMTANDGVVIEGDTANYALGSPLLSAAQFGEPLHHLPPGGRILYPAGPGPGDHGGGEPPGTASP